MRSKRMRESARCWRLLFTHCPSSAPSIHCSTGRGALASGCQLCEAEDVRLSSQAASKAQAGGSVSSWKAQCLVI